MNLTPRDLDIAFTLARRVRLKTLADLVCVWWPESYSFQTAWHRLRELAQCGVRLKTLADLVCVWWPESYSFQTAWHRLRELAQCGWVQLRTVNLRPLTATEPLFVWAPGRPDPNSERVSRAAKSRWTDPAVPTQVAFAGTRAANVYGSSGGRLAAVNHRDHDAHLGSVFALYRVKRPHEAADWVGEDARPKAGFRIKDPDALLMDAAGHPYRAIECAGSYAPVQVEALHEHCAEYRLPYELW